MAKFKNFREAVANSGEEIEEIRANLREENPEASDELITLMTVNDVISFNLDAVNRLAELGYEERAVTLYKAMIMMTLALGKYAQTKEVENIELS